MGIMATTTDGSMAYPQVPAGVHKSRCVKIIDLGTQRQEFSGEVSWKRQVMLIWEIPEQDNLNGEPMTISKFYTLSLHEKSNLGADLTSWRGRAFTETEKQGFDISKLVGVTCLLNCIEGNNGKIKITGIMPHVNELEKQFHESLFFSLPDFQNGDKSVFDELTPGIVNIILKAQELQGMSVDQGDGGNGADTDDVPF
tara:strand:- start:125 stop:718 length:594 start_codon:yes stop_codon:yes gene_type:complete